MPEDKFPSAVLDWAAVTLTYEELAMMWFIEQITNKPDWHAKVFNAEITAKWKAEVMAVDWAAIDLKWARFSDAMFENVCLMPVTPELATPSEIVTVYQGASGKGKAV